MSLYCNSKILANTCFPYDVSTLEHLLEEGQKYDPDNFIENYNKWAEGIKHKWDYKPHYDNDKLVYYIIYTKDTSMQVS